MRISLCRDLVEDHAEVDLEAALAGAALGVALAVGALAADRIITALTVRGARADTFSAAGAALITTAGAALAA